MELSRKLERFMIDRLQLAVPDIAFFGTEGDEEIEPPFVVVSVPNAEEIINRSNAYKCTGVIQVVSQIQDTQAEQQGLWIGQVKQAFDDIALTAPISDTDLDFTLHGLNLLTIEERDSLADMAHADIISFSAGASG